MQNLRWAHSIVILLFLVVGNIGWAQDYPTNTALAAGGHHSLALKTDGHVWAWGANYSGQVGVSSPQEISFPIEVSGLTNAMIIAAGQYHSLAIKSNQTLWAWGENGTGQLGTGNTNASSSPVQVSGLTNVAAAAGGWGH